MTKAPTKKSRAGRKPVQYRARHKNLGDLKEEDTKHGFEHRVKVERSKSHTSEPVYCSVWGDEQPVDSIELNSFNYRSAPTELEDHLRVRRPRTRRTSTTPISDFSSSAAPYHDVQISGNFGQEFLTSPMNNGYDAFPTTPEELLGAESFYPIVSGGYPEPLPARFDFHRTVTQNTIHDSAFSSPFYGVLDLDTNKPQLSQQASNPVWGYEASPISCQSGSMHHQNLSVTDHWTPPSGTAGLWTSQHIPPSRGSDHSHQNYFDSWDLDVPASDDYYVYGPAFSFSSLPSLPYTIPQLVVSHPYTSTADHYSATLTDETLPLHLTHNYGPFYNEP